ncbi:hypothetical protein AB2B41_01325 [Marimonas sp. MJW-29]|uniref:Uncharacterized protein n=1 Tax=Sulfitobacter sediminis TaxID=3234186 RepID=A0ABV3RGZ3_9RHOB
MRAALLLLALIAPAPALALSCLAPSVERSFARFDAAEEEYVVVHGRLTLDERDLPEGMIAEPPPPAMTHVEAKLRGSSLTREGFKLPFEQAITLEVACLGPWCGSAQNGEDVLAFVRKDADGYAIAVGPCGGSIFGTPKPEMLKAVLACLRDQNCTED